MLQIKTDVSPVYELLTSLFVFTVKNNYHDLGKTWVNEIKSGMDNEDFLTKMQQSDPLPFVDYMTMLIYKSPEKQDIPAFLQWLKGLSAGDIYELLSPYLSAGLPGELGEFRDYYAEVLRYWHQKYPISEHILDKLAEKAAGVESSVGSMDSVELIEQITNGIKIVPDKVTKQVIMIPSYHITPMNFVSPLNEILMITFPVEIPGENKEIPPMRLSRLTRALGDDKRLQILRILASKPYNLTELSRELQISKSNLHYHLTLLRTAGLVRGIKDLSNKHDRYEVRPDMFGQLKELLEEYVLGS
ncbi:ArsR/SmtB family transcription factor [Peribacillus sp. SCS-155]|uniref:ArsR/SmtB family transcription factor n=1 Tax=Peribacillus sedimenti TaxID=3115297 RepID=UPI00390673D9